MKGSASALDNTAKSLFILLFIVLALYFFGNILMPILFSGLVSLILLPIVKFGLRIKLNNTFAVLFTVLMVTLVLAGGIFIIVIQSQEIVHELPQLMASNDNFLNISSINISSETLTEYLDSHYDTIEENLRSLKGSIIDFVQGGFTGLKNTFVFLITCPIYIFFMLLYRDNVYRFIINYKRKGRETKESKQIIDQIKSSLYKYLKGLILVMLVIGTLTGLGLYFLGIKYALFLGILTALLTPIPYIGVVISAIIPITIAILTKDSLWYAVGVLSIFALVQFAEGNFITPRIMGNSVNINPLMILLSIVIIGSITGLIGLILTVPILAILKVIVDHYPSLKPWSYLLEDKKT
jgi:predicted PurR-regulated permease PerM